MKIKNKRTATCLFVLVQLICIAGLLPLTPAAEPPFRAAADLFPKENDSLRLKRIESHHTMLYRATDDGYKYCHHPNLTLFRDRLYCMWSNGITSEDKPGQRILYCSTADGVAWSEPAVLTEHLNGKGVCVAAGFRVAGDTLVAFYTTTPGDNFSSETALQARTSMDGRSWNEPRRITSGFFIEGPRQLSGGRLLLSGEHVGTSRKTQRMRLLYSDQADGLSGWQEAAINIENLDVFGYTEPSFFQQDENRLVMSFRNRSGFLYASASHDRGESWSTPVKTNFPDTRARFSAGNLPDGTAFLINNPGPHHRRFLTIALSNDRRTFDRAFLIYGKRTRTRYQGWGKALGWQYPNALAWKDRLYVAHSINKEDLGVTRILLKHLTHEE